MFCLGKVLAASRDTTARGLGRLKQRLHPPEIMRCGDQPEEPVDFFEASQFDLPHGPIELGPAEDLLYQLAFALADPGSRDRCVQGFGEEAGPLWVGRVLGDVGRHAPLPQVADELLLLIALIGAQGDRPGWVHAVDQRHPGLSFSRRAGLRGQRGDHQPMAILGQHMADITGNCQRSATLLEQPGLGISGGFMRVARRLPASALPFPCPADRA